MNLSIAERIELNGDLWGSMAETPDAIGSSEPQKDELDRQLDARDPKHRRDRV